MLVIVFNCIYIFLDMMKTMEQNHKVEIILGADPEAFLFVFKWFFAKFAKNV